MDKLEKPQFKIISTLVGSGIISIITFTSFLIPKVNEMSLFNIPLPWFIFMLSLLILFVFGLIKYFQKVNKFYQDYTNQFKEFNKMQENQSALLKQYKEKQEEITNYRHLLGEYSHEVGIIINYIGQGLINITKEEKDFISNLYNIALKEKEYLYNIKGER